MEIMATLKAPPSLEDIAIKHGVTVAALEAELAIGVTVESEHTLDPKIARVIATQQLVDDATYYTKRRFENAAGRPRRFKVSHLEPGPVKYNDLKDPVTGKTRDMVLLLRKPAIDRMRASASGVPVVNWEHKKIPAVMNEMFKKGQSDGIVTGSFFNSEDGWDWMEVLVWDQDTIKNCEKGFQGSCAYHPTELDMTPGMYHNIPYDGEILNGEYEHLAIVPNPRYEGSTIICNSLGGTMKKFWLKYFGKTEAVEMEGAEVEMDGKKVPLDALVNSYKAVKAEEEKAALENSTKGLTDDTIVTVDGKEVTVKDLKASHAAVLLKNAAEETAKKEAEEKAEEGRKDAEALKNAEDEEKAKKEKAEKEAEVLKNPLAESEKAKAEKEAAAEKAKGEQHFQDLKNAREKGGAPVKLPSYQSQEERLARGKAMWGREPAAEVKP